MKCISIQQPWAWLIVNGLKDIENRDWSTQYRGQVLIHAGKKVDFNCFEGDTLHSPGFYRMGGGLDVMKAVPRQKQDYETGGIVGIATLVDVVTRSKSPWFRGKYGFVLKDARPLPFVSLRGQLGLFEVPDELVQITYKGKL